MNKKQYSVTPRVFRALLGTWYLDQVFINIYFIYVCVCMSLYAPCFFLFVCSFVLFLFCFGFLQYLWSPEEDITSPEARIAMSCPVCVEN